MARRLSWSDVRGGLIACLAIVAVATAEFKFFRVGTLHGDTFRLFVMVGEARGVLVGSEVWLSGQKIGKITGITFRSPSVADSTSRLLVEMQVLEKYRGAMRHDATAQIRPGGTILGEAVVYILPGSVAAPLLRPGDTIRSKSETDLEGSAGKFGALTTEFPVIMRNVKELTTQLGTSQGSVGALLNAPGGPGGPEMARARAQATKLANQLEHRSDLVYANGSLTATARGAMARADSVRVLLQSPGSSYGRLRKDSTLAAVVSDIHNELSIVHTRLNQPVGTAGRVLHDSGFAQAVAGAERQMALLSADMKKHPFRYISF